LGSVYVFERDAQGAWAQLDRLFASDGVIPNEFGHAVALDGDTFIAGAPFVEDANGAFIGKAYVFVRSAAGTWSELQILQPAGITGGDFFGASVALDGDTAAIAGAQSAFVYTRGASGTWSLDTVLHGVSAQSVAVSGGTILVGGSFTATQSGAAVYAHGPG